MTKTDLSVGNLYPITIQRQYNSTSAYDSSLGYGWSLNYDKRIYTYPDNSVIVRKDCGRKLRFIRSGSGFTSPSGEYGSIVQNIDGTYTYTDINGSREIYDLHGRIAYVVSPKGNSLVFTYGSDVRGPMTGLSLFNLDQTNPQIVSYDYRLSMIEERDSTSNPTGNRVSFSYDPSTGRLNGLWDNTGRSVIYTHDTIGNLNGISGPSTVATYGYNSPVNRHSLTDIDEGQGTYINAYDNQGRVTKQTHGTGVIDIAYWPNRTVNITTTVTGPDGTTLNTQTRTVEFSGLGMVNKNTDTFGNVTNYIRDSQSSKLLREEYWENTGTVDSPNLVLRTANNYTYDSKGNMLTKTEAQGTPQERTTTYTYHPTFNGVLTTTVKSVVDPNQNKVTTNTYDDTTGNLLTTNEAGLLGDGTPYSYTTAYTYDSNGRLATIDGPRTDVQDITNYYYDSSTGYLTSMTQPLAGTTTYANFDALGEPQTVTDPNGNSTTYTYDTMGRVLTVKAPGDTSATQYFYTSGGCPSCGASRIDHITLPEGNTINYHYDDGLGNLTSISDSLGNSINYTYDSEGNKLKEDIRDSSGSLQKTLSYQYDVFNRLAQIINPDSTFTQIGYDSRGNRASTLNPNGNSTSYQYDALNRLTTVIQPGSVTTSYSYNSNNNLTSVTDANNNATTYKYDDQGRVYQVISPDTGNTTYQYDPAGNLTRKTDAKGISIAYIYDAANRLTKIDFQTDTDIIYVYDTCLNGKGRLCSMSDASGTTTYVYSPKGQVNKETKTIDSIQHVTQYTYDQNGNVKTMTYPSGKVITYNYTNDNAVSVLNGVTNLATNINYKPFGGMSSITYGNGLAGSIGYDNHYRIVSMATGTLQNLIYADDANGNITGVTNNLDATKNKTFTYDALDRLASANGSWGALGWTYDGVGNRQAENSSSYAYAANTNKLTDANAISFGYDSNGNTTTEGSKQYIYNQNQRLIQVNNGGTTAYYTYNGNGQRVKKIVNGTTTIFHYNQNGQIIAESNSSGTITAEYVYLNGQPLAKIGGVNTYYYHNDHLGAPNKMTDSSGTVVWSADYKPFGEATVTVSTITNNLRFPGQYFDTETGNHYNYFRDYNPSLGRYIQADPIGIRKGENHIYAYASSSPLRRVDPQGLLSTVETAFYKALAAGSLAEAAMILEEAGSCINAETRAAMSEALALANKLHHIFDNVDHNLDPLINIFGSESQAYSAIVEATTNVINELHLTGIFEVVVNVGGQNVTVRGNVVNGVAQIGTAFIK